MKVKTPKYKHRQQVKIDGHDVIGIITEVNPIEFNKHNKAHYWVTFPDVDRNKYPDAGYVKVGQRIDFDDDHKMSVV